MRSVSRIGEEDGLAAALEPAFEAQTVLVLNGDEGVAPIRGETDQARCRPAARRRGVDPGRTVEDEQCPESSVAQRP
ncbi:MAG: hypothetical protein WBQ50_12425, partial [Nocardioides sp.]